MTTWASSDLAKSTRRPWKAMASTRSSPAKTSWMSSTRSSTLNIPFLVWVAVWATATIRRSAMRRVRRAMSSCPLVMGSKEPG